MVPFILKIAIENILNLEHTEALRMVWWCSVVLVVLFIVLYYCNKYIKYHGNLMGTKIEADMRKELFEHLQKMPLQFYNDRKIGDILSKITVELYNIGNFLHVFPEEVTTFFIKFLGASIALFIINKLMALIVVFIIFSILLYAVFYIPKINKVIVETHEKFAGLSARVEENLHGMHTIQSFANEDLEVIKFGINNRDYINSKARSYKISSVFDAVTASFVITLIPIITMMSLFLVLNNKLRFNDVIVSMLYIDMLVGPLFSIFSLISSFQENIAGYRRFLEALETKPQIDSSEIIEIDNFKKDIIFKNVSFSYDHKVNVINNLSLKIKFGERIALVGKSGAGKTTLSNLIARFYEPTKGKILVGNVDIRNISIKEIRKNIGFVLQDVFLFSGTLLENIKYGNVHARYDDIIKASIDACAHDFIMRFPDGYDTEIGQNGIKLSGGQKQRIALARVFLKDPPILILDEATSNLDNESEKYIQMSLEKLTKNRTTITIAHRISTIKNADRILVMDHGKIVEEGTHEELIYQEGIYTNFYELI